jgi:beta-phosphoglucomutase-like phosphatase (HAD superfamily)
VSAPAVLEALLFDLDGTLVDTREANRLAYTEAMAAHGHELTREAFDATWGRDARDFLPDLVPGISPQEVDAIRAAKAAAYGAHLPGARVNAPLVGWLRTVAPTHATALVTTAKTLNGRQVLAAHDLEGLFDVAVYGDDVERGKPDPEAYTAALERLGVAPEAALAFEDSATGVAAATAAGVRVLRVPAF